MQFALAENTITVPLTQTSYFPALTGLRAVAAYIVYLHHFPLFEAYKLQDGTIQQKIYYLCGELHIGVAIFFCLSGFLIAHRYLNKVEFGVKWLAKYFRNRFARIYPVYFILTCITFLLNWIYEDHNTMGPQISLKYHEEFLLIFGMNLTFLRGFSNFVKFSGISQGWSLTVEETFYLFAPVILWASTKFNKWLPLVFFACFFITTGLLLVCLFSLRPILGFMETYKFMWSYTFFGRCIEFLVGIALALLIRTSFQSSTSPSSIYTLVGTALIMLCLYLLNQGDMGYKNEAISYTGLLVNNALLALAVAILLLGLIKEKNAITTFLSSKLIQLLGKSSYVFYLIHLGFITTWLKNAFSGFYLVKFGIVVLLSIAIYRLVEEPLNNYIRRKITIG